MDYSLVADALWYSGHVLTCSSVLFSSNRNLAISLVFIGQFITIISRPIGRIKNIKIDIEPLV